MRLLGSLLLRLATTALTLLALLVLCLALLRAVPGGPFDQEKLAPPEVQAALAARYRLDQPFWVQVSDYLGHALRGDLGPSFQYSDYSVQELIAGAAPITLTLGGLAALLAIGAGICDALGHISYVTLATAGHIAVASALVGVLSAAVVILLAVTLLRERLSAPQLAGFAAAALGIAALAA